MTTTIYGTVTALGTQPDVHARIAITGGSVTNGGDSANITGGEMIIALDSTQGIGDVALGSAVVMTLSKFYPPPTLVVPPAEPTPEPEAAAPATEPPAPVEDPAPADPAPAGV